MITITVVHNGQHFQLEVDPADGAEVLKMQISSLIDLETDKMTVTGLGAGYIHDLSDLSAMRPGHVLTVTAGSPSSAPSLSSPGQPARPLGGAITMEAFSAALQAATKQKSPEELAMQKGIKEMEARILSHSQHVKAYEDPQIQAQALRVIPVEEIRRRAAENPESLGPRDAVVRKLLAWFKFECFKWVNNAPCEACKSGNTSSIGGAQPNSAERAGWAGVVEVYKCNDCQKLTRFPRLNHPGKLMETKQGRCGEWANAFTLCCIAMGYEARHVVDWTDHVWTEVYSEDQERWVHCDPCENAWDGPLLYAEGWGKQLTYVIAFSKDDVRDVTARYTRKYNECLGRRNKVPEAWLAEHLAAVSAARRAAVGAARRAVLERRAAREAAELVPRNYVPPAAWEPPTASVLPGRTTGSVEWRAARGELGVSAEAAAAAAAAASADAASAAAAGAAAAGEEEGAAALQRVLARSATYGGTHADTAGFDDAGAVARELEALLADAFGGGGGGGGGGAGVGPEAVRVVGLRVWAKEGGVVYGVQVQYQVCLGDLCRRFWAPEHLGSAAAAEGVAAVLVSLEPSHEHVAQLRGRSGGLVDALEVHVASTRSKEVRVHKFGGIGGKEFAIEVPADHRFFALKGGLGGHLHNIAAYAFPVPPIPTASPIIATTVVSPTVSPAPPVPSTTVTAPQPTPAAAEDAAAMIRRIFQELRSGGMEPNDAAAAAVSRAREMMAVAGRK